MTFCSRCGIPWLSCQCPERRETPRPIQIVACLTCLRAFERCRCDVPNLDARAA